MMATPTLYLCAEHYDVVIEAIQVMGEEDVMTVLEVSLGVPPGGLDKVLILRAEAPPRYEEGRWRWAQLRFCQYCGNVSGSGSAPG